MDPLKKKFSFNYNNILAVFFFLAITLAGYVSKNKLQFPNITFSKEKYAINFNASIHFFNIGFNRLISSLLWVETLMNSDLDRDFDTKDKSWMYFRFLTIAKLEPKFIENYQYGGQYLSIVKDDLNGAEYIYQLGINIYPTDYFLNYNLAFLYFNERDQYQKALPLLMKIKNNPNAPAFISSLVATMMQKSNVATEDIIKFVEEQQKLNKYDFFDDIYERKLEILRKLKK